MCSKLWNCGTWHAGALTTKLHHIQELLRFKNILPGGIL
jgi:hypothetical protein